MQITSTDSLQLVKILKSMNTFVSTNSSKSNIELLIPFLFIALICLIALPQISIAKDKNYDTYFQKYTEQYFSNDIDWRLIKSQAYIESRLKPSARSHRGATGIMQLMPRTFREIQNKHKYFKSRSIKTPETNIRAGIFYDAYLFKRWNDINTSSSNRIKLMFASYNGGFARVLKAFHKAGKPKNNWQAIAKLLPRETREYVSRIMQQFASERANTPQQAESVQILASANLIAAKFCTTNQFPRLEKIRLSQILGLYSIQQHDIPIGSSA